MEGLDGVLENWLNRLHDTESSLHIVNLWLHTLDGLHFSGDLDEWLSIIKSLENSSSEGLLDVLNGSGLGNSGVTITSGLGGESLVKLGLEGDKELVLVHGLISLHGLEELGIVVMVVVVSGGDGGESGENGEFHFNFLYYKSSTYFINLYSSSVKFSL